MSVEPEIGDQYAEERSRVRPGFPLRYGKVQRPLLSDETLRRDRLLDWMAFRGRRRIVCVIAEAGFGKTTLVADYLQRSRRRIFWYRLDEDDTDGLAFMRYLVASCQSVEPHLLRRTASVLNETAIEPLRQETALETLLTELDPLGEVPSALVLDDFHVVESNESVTSVVDRLLARGPEQLAIYLVSRRTPHLGLASLRARGQVAEVTRNDLRFEERETEQLFRDIYRHPLEADVLHDLQARTEGWAASLRLVGTAVDGRTASQVRAFVHSIAGSKGDLYDYLAQEVIGDLDQRLRSFLMRTSLMEEMDAGSASVAAGIDPGEAGRLLTRAQELGLVSRSAGAVAAWRAHPLVREFLAARLESELGAEGIRELHRHLAAAFEAESWRLAARHWAAAGEAAEVRRVLCGAVPAIVGTGDLAVAEDFMSRFPDPSNPYYALLHSRKLSSEGRLEEALAAAEPVFSMDPETLAADPALETMCALSRLHLGVNSANPELRAAGTDALARCGDEELAAIAAAAELMAASSDTGALDVVSARLKEAARLNEANGHFRHLGISLLNLALVEFAQANHAGGLEAGRAAIRLLTPSGCVGDIAAAHMNAAKLHAHLGHTREWQEAASYVMGHLTDVRMHPDIEPLAEAAELELMYGDPARGAQILRTVLSWSNECRTDGYVEVVARRAEMLTSEVSPPGPFRWAMAHKYLMVGFRSWALACWVQALVHHPDPTGDIASEIERALMFSAGQQAWFCWRSIRLTKALVAPPDELNAHVHTLETQDSGYLSIQAELVTRRFEDLDRKSLEIVRKEAVLRPERWRWALRQLFDYPKAGPGDIRQAVELMELVGGPEDVALLRSLARNKSLKMPDAGRALARRLAPQAYVEDLGRVSIRIGERVMAGTEVRKKVLSLLVFLLTRPQMTATREQVMEALWPDMDPVPAANSLNQTAYFLRQLFEPTADDDSAAGYLNCKADLMWLERDLVHSRSADCLELLAATRRDPEPELVSRLAEMYPSRFAVDFIYDEWASAFRDTMHAAYLDRVERSIALDIRAGYFDRAISVAQLALAADPEAEQIELQLLRLYRRTGAHAAAAEQYAHYAAVMREQLGVEPPPLESL